jgi:hypothetical protein
VLVISAIFGNGKRSRTSSASEPSFIPR